MAVTALRIKASEQLAGTIDELNAVVTSVALDWDQATQGWIERTTRNPASLFRRVLQGGGAQEPLADSDIDLEQLEHWHEVCEANGYACDLVVDFETSVDEVLEIVAATGTASPARPGGNRSVVIDEPVPSHVQDLSPRSVIGLSQRRIFVDSVHAFRVSFFNQQAGWKLDERIVYFDGFDQTNATRIEDLELPGITHPDLVYRHARRRMAEAVLRQETTEIETDLRHLVATRGDVIRVAHDAVLWGSGWGRITSVDTDGSGDGVAITLDEAIVLEAGRYYVARIQRSDGTSDTQRLVTTVGESRTLSLLDIIPAAELPAPGDQVIVGEQDRETVELLIIGISPGPDLTATLVCVPYDIRLFASDVEPIPDFESSISLPAGSSVPLISSVRSDETVGYRRPDGLIDLRAIVGLYNDGSRAGTRIASVEVRWRQVGSTEPWLRVTAPWDAVDVALDGVEVGTVIEVAARYVFRDGHVAPWSSAVRHTVTAPTPPPPDVSTAFVENDVLIWSYPDPDPDHAGFRVRFGTGATAAWQQATEAHAGIVTTDRLALSSLSLGGGEVTLLVKAVDAYGQESAHAARVVYDRIGGSNLHAVTAADLKALGWPGEIRGGSVSGSVIVSDNPGDFLPDPTGFFLDQGSYLFDSAGAGELTYYASHTVGEVEAGDEIRVSISGTGRLEIYYHLPTFGGGERWDPTQRWDPARRWPGLDDLVWQPWPGALVATSGQRIAFRVKTAGAIQEMRIQQLARVKSETINDLTVPAMGVRLPLSINYRRVLNVIPILPSGSSAAIVRIADRSVEGPLVLPFDTAGNPVPTSADFRVEGV